MVVINNRQMRKVALSLWRVTMCLYSCHKMREELTQEDASLPTSRCKTRAEMTMKLSLSKSE